MSPKISPYVIKYQHNKLIINFWRSQFNDINIIWHEYLIATIKNLTQLCVCSLSFFPESLDFPGLLAEKKRIIIKECCLQVILKKLKGIERNAFHWANHPDIMFFTRKYAIDRPPRVFPRICFQLFPSITVNAKFSSLYIVGSVALQRALFREKLKADRPHPHNYPPTPTDYRHTDKHLRLVMPLIALYCTRQSRVSTDRRTDGRTDATKYIISLASRSIKIYRKYLGCILNDQNTYKCSIEES